MRKKYLLYLCSFLSSYCFFSIIPILPIFLNKIEGDLVFWLGPVSGVSFLLSALSAPLWGILADKIGAKKMLVRSAFGQVISYALLIFASDGLSLFLIRAFHGLVAGFVPATIAYVLKSSEFENKGKEIGLVVSATQIGGILSPLISSSLITIVGYEKLFILNSVLMFIASWILLFYIKSDSIKKIHFKDLFFAISSIQIFKKPPIDNPQVKLPKKFGHLIIFSLILGVSTTCLQPVLPLILLNISLNESELLKYTGWTFTLAGIATAIATPLWGMGTVNFKSSNLMLAMILIGGVAISGLSFSLENHLLVVIFYALFSTGISGVNPIINSHVGDIVSEDRVGYASSLIHSTRQFTLGLGPSLGGFVASFFGNNFSLYLVLIGLLISGLYIKLGDIFGSRDHLQ